MLICSFIINALLLLKACIKVDGFVVNNKAGVIKKAQMPSLVKHRGAHLHMSGSSSVSSNTQDAIKRTLAIKNPEKIRNVAFIGHSHSGKSSLVEWMLFDEEILNKRPMNGLSVLDNDPTEASRHSSIFSHYVKVPHNDYLFEVMDTPWGDFPSDALASLDGADSAVIVISGADGVQSGSLKALEHCKEFGIRNMIALSKMDRPFIEVEDVLMDIEEATGMAPIPLQVLVGKEDNVQVKSLFLFDESGEVRKNEDQEVQEAWMLLEEAVAMTNDDLLTEYLESNKLDSKVVLHGLRDAFIKGAVLPLVYTSAEKDIGVLELMDIMANVLPSPVEMREEALRRACEENNDDRVCGVVEAGVEAGFAARVLHTSVDAFGSLTVLRIISNDHLDDDEKSFKSLPNEATILRTGEKIKLPSGSACFALYGKERQPLNADSEAAPGNVIAVPKLPDSVQTNDILVIPQAVSQEQVEIELETESKIFSPLSRIVDDFPLMTSATITLADTKSTSKTKSNQGSDDRLISSLKSISREDLSLKIEQDAGSGKLLLHCMSSDHLQIITARLKDRYNIDVELGKPPVAYRETITKPIKKVEGRHKKQSGGSGQFGVCVIDLEPLEEGSGVEFESKIKGGVISKPFISSVEKGVREQLMAGGPTAGYPVTDVKVILIDGKMHSVDSKDIAFQSAGKLAIKAALQQGKTKILQPMENVVFNVPESLQGEINSIISRVEGYVTTTDADVDHNTIIVESVIPSASIGEVSDLLRAASGGDASYTSTFSHYQVVPEHLLDDVLANCPLAKE